MLEPILVKLLLDSIILLRKVIFTVLNLSTSLLNNYLLTHLLYKVKCFNLALGDKTEFVEIYVYESDASVLNSLKKDSQNQNSKIKEKIEVTTGDRFCNEHSISEIDILKIDTEGYELEVLQGFNQLIEKNQIKTIYCEVGFSPSNKRNTFINDLIMFMSKNNFTFFGLYEVSNHQIKTACNYGNALFVNNELIKKMK